MTSSDAAAPNPVRRQDAEALVGILAVVEGELMSGAVDRDLASRLANRFVGSGLLASEPGGQLPSPGHVVVAMEDLIQRLRFVLGEYDSEPPTRSNLTTTHQLRFPSRTAAESCQAELSGEQAGRIWMESEPPDSWTVHAVYPELPGNEDFFERAQGLLAIGRRLGGRYVGSQASA